MRINVPKNEEEVIEFIRRTGLIGLSLSVLYILFNLVIFDIVVLSEPNSLILYTEIGLVSGILGSAFATPRVVEDEAQGKT